VLLECSHYNVVRQRYFNVSSLHELIAQNILGFIRDAYEPGGGGGLWPPDSGKAIIFRAKAKLFGQKPTAKNEKHSLFFLYIKRKKTEFIPSSETKCPKSGIFTNIYWVCSLLFYEKILTSTLNLILKINLSTGLELVNVIVHFQHVHYRVRLKMTKLLKCN